MINFEYQLNPEDEWKISSWPWTTIESINSSILDRKVKFDPQNMTFEDFCQLRTHMSSLATSRGIGHRIKINAKASEASLKHGTSHGIKELFTAGCPICKRKGEPIPRHEDRFKNVPPGLYCPDCDKAFRSRSIYFYTPVFAVAAGPSLDKNILQLKRIEGKYPIFCVDTALPSLQMAGIKPDYMVTVESDPLINEMKFDSEGITLIANLQVDYKFRQNWKGPVYLTDTPSLNPRDAKQKMERHGDIGWASVGGNVSSIMFSILCGNYPSYIIFVGHDFSYPHLQNYYPSGGPMSMAPNKQVYRTHDIYGDYVYTDASLHGYKSWTEAAIQVVSKNKLTKFVNATEGGILGATYYDPEKLIHTKRKLRILKYKINTWLKEKKWPTREEAEENGFQGSRLKCIEYITLREAIDKYCPLAIRS